MDKNEVVNVQQVKGTKKNKKISTKLLMYILPVVVLAVIALINIAASVAKRRMSEMATETLESSISNQADNIEAWLDENLRYFSTVKYTIESQGIQEADYNSFLDAYYGYNSNAPKGFYIGTSDGKFYKASEADIVEDNVTGSTWYKQGITRVEMSYGTAYTNETGETVISATGILNDGSDTIKVIGADVTLNKISIIVNSGVKMSKASSFLVDTNDYKILAHRDFGVVNTVLSESSSDALLSGAAKAIMANNRATQEIGNYMVAFYDVEGTDWILVSYIPTNIIMQTVSQLGMMLLVVGAVAIVLITIMILFVVKRVVAPLSNISNNIAAMSEGDFTITVDSSSNDEIGVMGSKVSDFVTSMRKMLSSISNESDKLQEESDNSDRVAKTMYEASQSQAEAMKQLNETVDQLATAVNDIAENATTLAQVVADTRDNSEKANQSMKDTVEISQKGRSDMEKLSSAMDGIADANERLVESINKVGSASEEITNIVGMIGEIAEETNLLSLNASIEAARAGEAGKGFAVVATQIAKLAQTSAESAQNISNLIEEVHRLIADAVGQANASADSIQENSELIGVAVNTFDQIYNNIQDSNALIESMIENIEKVDDVATNVAAISEEQAASADEILATSENMVEMANDITRSSQDVADNSHELAGTSQTLTSYVQKFKI
ncbi:methyl-accepting chemotaxis protein [Butyrivibrio sp. YAB3001]|uniref:methyl-accepting chemotaxis protein n=1 Tax=Butyrivibrio sp. YAB3001 TaxID=1520812 RepID=UPI0008F6760C|nr:methyl-accepting chemotaxis protein [Butyrivibrio sp. YAB3001]SFB72006.1 methyl-accepting chemotaxis protein [Butyrivibrio sp. YAB3001]